MSLCTINDSGFIRVTRYDIDIVTDAVFNEVYIRPRTPEALDSIIEQCRDIKLKLMEAQKNG